jgi:hypothetical protein
LQENLRACYWLLFFTFFLPPHFDDAPFALKNEALGVNCSCFPVILKLSENVHQYIL